jgi:hypothetical protein
MVKKILLANVIALAATSVMAQTDSTKKPTSTTTFTFSADAYYRYDFADQLGNNKTSFTNSNNSFELGMASVKVDHSFGKIGATIDLGFGRRAAEFSYNDGAGVPVGAGNGYTSLAAIKQAYVSYAASDKVKFTIGKWATHIGYELVDAYANRNYSMSYMFSYGPFFHTGAKVDFTLGGGSGLMIGVANPTDYSTTSSPVKTLLGQFSHVGDKTSFFVNYQGYFGAKNSIPTASSLNQVGLTLTTKLSSKFMLGYDGTVQSVKDEVAKKTKSWWGSALYFNLDPTDKFGLTLRTEYFADKKDALKVGDDIFATTLSANFKMGNLTIIPELRYDAGSNNTFLKNDGTATKSGFSALIAATYKF